MIDDEDIVGRAAITGHEQGVRQLVRVGVIVLLGKSL
jgi:hypothetical protein